MSEIVIYSDVQWFTVILNPFEEKPFLQVQNVDFTEQD